MEEKAKSSPPRKKKLRIFKVTRFFYSRKNSLCWLMFCYCLQLMSFLLLGSTKPWVVGLAGILYVFVCPFYFVILDSFDFCNHYKELLLHDQEVSE